MTLYTAYYNEFQNKYTMYMPLTIAMQSCVGAIAAMYILMNGLDTVSSLLQLFLCVVFTSFYNAAVIAQMKGGIVFKMLIASLLVSTVLIIINVF